jgi:hypothetical protein
MYVIFTLITFQPEVLRRIMSSLYTLQFTRNAVVGLVLYGGEQLLLPEVNTV